MAGHGSDIDRSAEWEALKARYLRPLGERPASSARGLHHFAVLSSDVERTISFYQDILESFRWSNCSRTGTIAGRPTSFSTSAMATIWRTSTSPALTSVNIAKCSEAFITSPFQSLLSSGIGWFTNWKLPESRPSSWTAPRSTFRGPMASGSNFYRTHSTTCTGRS